MGFGLMFVGYFFTYLISLVFVPRILGYAIMLWATVKLSAFDIKFKRCLPVLGGLFLISAYVLSGDIVKHFNLEASLFNDTVLNIVSTAEELLVILFHVFLMLAIGSIAKDTGLDKIRFRAMRNLLLIMIAELTYTVIIFLPKNKVVQTVFAITVILRFIWIFLDLILLASCYRLICEEGDESMPEKEINVPIIKQMESVMRRRDKNAFDSGKRWSEKRQNKKEKRKKKDK